jgi:hypothetical protein
MLAPTNRLIVGFAGSPGTGKTSMAEYFWRAHSFVDTAINTPALQMLKGLLPFDGKRMANEAFRNRPNDQLANKTPAEVLAKLRIFLDSAISHDFLQLKLAEQFKAHPFFNWTVDDVHTDHDARFLINHKAFMVHCTRPGFAPSEIDPDLFDLVLDCEDIDQAATILENTLFS